jgi:hypothetical protein
MATLEESEQRRRQAMMALLTQLDTQARYASDKEKDALAERKKALEKQEEAQYQQDIRTGGETAKGFAIGSSLTPGSPVGGIVGSILSTIPAKGREFQAREKKEGTEKAILDTFINPFTTVPSLVEGITGGEADPGAGAGVIRGTQLMKGQKSGEGPKNVYQFSESLKDKNPASYRVQPTDQGLRMSPTLSPQQATPLTPEEQSRLLGIAPPAIPQGRLYRG